jgi:hypothetical protein
MRQQYRAYVLGFRPEWANVNRNLCERLIAEVDFCIDRSSGVAIGERLDTYLLARGNPDIAIPRKMVCVGHEYEGKIVIVETVNDSV